MHYKAGLFDLDGTLVDTSDEYRHRLLGEVLKNCGKEYNANLIDKWWFDADRDKTIRDGFGIDPQQFWTQLKQCQDIGERCRYTKPYDDITVLPILKKYNVKLGIITAAPATVADPEIELVGRNQFDVIIYAHSDNGVQDKPHPEGLLLALEKMKVNRNEAFYVGNSPEDIKLARNAGMVSFYIERGKHTFNGQTPTIKIHSLHALEKVVLMGVDLDDPRITFRQSQDPDVSDT
ncbi:HAD family hydrolase [Candidatus Pacearchaeota archaeon]|nr:HAD family hydrolase [Candidatus Pacearchaeota archaeon]